MINNKPLVSANVQIASGEQQLRLFGKFLTGHDQLLDTLIGSDSKDEQQFGPVIDKIDFHQTAPISIDYDRRYESLDLFQLVNSDNKILNKIIIVFARLCEEVRHLQTDANRLQLKLLHLDDNLMPNNDSNADQQHQQQQIIRKIGELLPHLCEIQYFLNRCLTVSLNIVQQLGILFADGYQFLNTTTSIHFQSVFGHLADLMLILEIFDECLKRSNLNLYWTTFLKSMDFATLDEFGEIEIELDAVHSVLSELQLIFKDSILKNFLDSVANVKRHIAPLACKAFQIHLVGYIKNLFTECQQYDGDLTDTQSREVIKLTLMSTLIHISFGGLEPAIWRTLIDVNIKYSAIPLIENILWQPDEFLRKYAQSYQANLHKSIVELQKTRQNSIQGKCTQLPKDTSLYFNQMCLWIMNVQEAASSIAATTKLENMIQCCAIIMDGIQQMAKITFHIKAITNLHCFLMTAMTKQTLIQLCKLLECLQIYRVVFVKHLTFIIEIVTNISQHLTYQALQIIDAAKNKMAVDTSLYDERNIDILSALQIAEKCMYGPLTGRRILIARLALSCADPVNIFSQQQLDKLCRCLSRQETMIQLTTQIECLSNTSFLYWHQTMLPIYLKHLIDSGGDCIKIKYIVYASNITDQLLNAIELDQTPGIRNYILENRRNLREMVLAKLCANIETHLRFDAHSNLTNNRLTVESTSGTTAASSSSSSSSSAILTNELHGLVNLKPLQLSEGQYFQFKCQIEHYLSTMFYNSTTIALHDWRTYGEMRCLANLHLNLETVDDHLPTQTIEQGLDVLEIMRNIHVFVSKYLYNLNNQIFIQHSSNNKHLDTINIRHIANSLRTHGTGIINTTVNFTYQFLRKKFAIFSQFLYDELIKSRLTKDLKYFRENRERLNQMYNFDRAELFCREIKKLGLPDMGLSYLDLFRQLISHIGNALGFVRMMRSGGIHCDSNANTFLPNHDADMIFSQMAIEHQFSNVTIEAATNFENEIKQLSSSSIETTDYFQLLITAFAPFFRNAKNIHLKNFYLIVPPLTINFVEYILMAKDRMTKQKNKNESSFTDDGFAIGLVYILKLLDQMSDFNSLYWFKSVRQKYLKEREQLREQQKTNAGTQWNDEKLQQTLSLTEKRINSFLDEFDLLYCNLSSAKNFFK